MASGSGWQRFDARNVLTPRDRATSSASSSVADAWKQEQALQEEEYEEGLAEDDASFLSWEQVLAEEQELIGHKRKAREAAGARGVREPFSLAFSGGGVRAAAFQSGVLRQLAEAGRIQDIEYLAAVSGGGYLLSAFASHVIARPPPKAAEKVDDWYREAVATTIVRMQTNAGNFVRDFWKFPGIPADGAGFTPRICDIPLLLIVFLFTIFTGPCLFVTAVLLPVTEIVEIYFGYGMRAAFCAPETRALHHVLMEEVTYLRSVAIGEISLLVVSFVAFLVEKAHPVRISPSPSAEDTESSSSYVNMFCHSLRGVCNRLAGCVGVIIVLVFTAVYVERLVFDVSGWKTLRVGICGSYACSNGTTLGYNTPLNQCDVYELDDPWYKQPSYRMDYFCHDDGSFSMYEQETAQLINGDAYVARQDEKGAGPTWSGAKAAIALVGLSVVVSIVIIPFAPWVLPRVILTVGPGLCFVIVLAFIQFRVFGPITGQRILSLARWDRHTWDTSVCYLIGLTSLLLPFLKEIKSVWHWYYVKSLQKSFFDDGEDRTLAELKADAWCPFVLLTGTVNDFKRPTDEHSISEISFSPLHTGSVECGYVRSPPQRSLAQCTALTGAGCLDAISLSMQDHVRVRFWLEVLNLSWGDYILFEAKRSQFMRCLLTWVPYSRRRVAAWWLHRLITMVWSFVNMMLIFTGLCLYRFTPEKDDCIRGRNLITWAIVSNTLLISLSFFTFFRYISGLAFSPYLRQIHQATRFIHESWHPPRMLYVTDGGVQDCTAIVQLLRRRCERILLVLAASDPDDDLAVLRTTLQAASHSMKLASFYDFKDPRRDVRAVLDEFKQQKNAAYIKMGIRYGWTENQPHEEVQLGTLWIVKNRLPDAFLKQRVEPLLTESEILAGGFDDDVINQESMWGSDSDVGEDLGDMKHEDLAGLCCCDCCHSWANWGRPFPHLTFTGYMWLTPLLFSSLSRLGHRVSEYALNDMFKPAGKRG